MRARCAGASPLLLAGTLLAAPAAPVKPPAGPSFEALVKQAVALQGEGKSEEAAREYRRALRLRPDWTGGHLALGSLLYNLERYDEALEHFKRVVAANPQDGFPLALQGLCQSRQGRRAEALADLRKALALGISNAEILTAARLQAGLLFNREGNPEAGFETLRDLAIQGNDGPAVIEAIGLATLRRPWLPEEVPADKREMILLAGRGGYHLARGRRTAVGRMALDELIFRFPNEPNVHYALGAYLGSAEPEPALAEFRRELARDPDHYPSLVQVAALELGRGNPAEALPAAERAVAAAPTVPAGHLMLGKALFETGPLERAVSELERARDLAPDAATIRFSLARAYQKAGRTQEAAREREAFRRLNAEAPAAPGEPEAEPEAAKPPEAKPDQPLEVSRP